MFMPHAGTLEDATIRALSRLWSDKRDEQEKLAVVNAMYVPFRATALFACAFPLLATRLYSSPILLTSLLSKPSRHSWLTRALPAPHARPFLLTPCTLSPFLDLALTPHTLLHFLTIASSTLPFDGSTNKQRPIFCSPLSNVGGWLARRDG